MAISNYSELQTAVAGWIDRDDLADRIEEFIALGEARIYRDLKINAMVKGFNATIGAVNPRQIVGPTDFIELRDARINLAGGGVRGLEYATTDFIVRRYPNRALSTPLYIHRTTGNDFGFGPAPDSDYSVSLKYYARLPALSDSNTTNWFTENAPDILMWASLVESVGYTMDDERLGVWESKYVQIVNQIQKEDDKTMRSRSPARSTPG
jgi:hypothetical protein